MERTCIKRVTVCNEMVPEKLFQLRDYRRRWLIEVDSRYIGNSKDVEVC